jgi:hypothetical protein
MRFGEGKMALERTILLDGSEPCSDANSQIARCGDGIVTAGEECDCGDGTVAVPLGCLGPNGDNTYGGCATKCMRGTAVVMESSIGDRQRIALCS